MARAKWGRRILLGGGALVLVLGVAAGGFLLPRLDAVRCLIAFSGSPPGEDGALLPGQTLRIGEAAVLGFERVLVQRPDDAPRPVLVFIHGVAVKGLSDARVLQAVDAFAQGGFLVVAPEVPLLVEPPNADDDETRLTRLLETIESGAIEGGRHGRFGLVGVSVGGALAIRAAARFRARGGSGLRAVLAIGAPDDLRTLATTWFSLPRRDPDVPWTFEQQRRNEAEFARNVIFRAALGARIEVEAERAELRAWLEADQYPPSEPPSLTTDASRRFIDLVLAGPDVWQTQQGSLVDDAWPLMGAFSTAEVAGDMHHLAGVTCFLLQGAGDSLVPASEYHALSTRLSAHTLVVGLESRMLGHVDVDAVGLREQAEHVVFMDDFFAAIR